MKKIITLGLITMLLFVATACGGPQTPSSGDKRPPEKIQDEKTQLYVSNYDGGYGTEWLYAVKDRFEAEYAETEFEEGKKGVQIIVHADKDGYYGVELYNRMGVTSDEVFFSEGLNFNDFVHSDYLLGLNDVVKNKNFDGKTILSKMSDEQRNSLELEGNYYVIPHYVGCGGINYDIDLFNSKKLYYAKDGAPSELGYGGKAKYTDLAGERSAGPDGEYGTYDDGLPATYDELFALCGYMKQAKGITPFCWTGQYHTTYSKWILSALAADYEGKEQMMLNYEFNGTATHLATVSGSGITIDANGTEIVNSNGYELYRSAGRYYALKFFENIIKNNYFDPCGFDDGCSHASAQTKYLRSSYNGEPIAMLLEGIWWVNEAKDTFSLMENRYGEEYSIKNRRFGMMPMPKASADKIGEKSTIIDTHYSFSFIRKNISEKKAELAKLFLKYCYTDESLKEFTKVTGLPKALDYDLGSEMQWASPYSKNVWDLYANSDKVYPFSQNKLYLSAQSSFVYGSTFVTATQKSALDALYNGMTAENYFADIVSFRNKSLWDNAYSKYF